VLTGGVGRAGAADGAAAGAAQECDAGAAACGAAVLAQAGATGAGAAAGFAARWPVGEAVTGSPAMMRAYSGSPGSTTRSSRLLSL